MFNNVVNILSPSTTPKQQFKMLSKELLRTTKTKSTPSPYLFRSQFQRRSLEGRPDLSAGGAWNFSWKRPDSHHTGVQQKMKSHHPPPNCVCVISFQQCGSPRFGVKHRWFPFCSRRLLAIFLASLRPSRESICWSVQMVAGDISAGTSLVAKAPSESTKTPSEIKPSRVVPGRLVLL